MSYCMKFGEEMSEEFLRKISFHMLQISLHPYRSIEFTEKFMNDARSCEHTKRVCAQLIERVNKFKRAEAPPEIENLEFAASWMQSLNFQDHYVRIAGMYLQMMISLMHEGSPQRGVDASDEPSQ